MVVHPSSHGDSSCPAVLWIHPLRLCFAYRTLTLFGVPSHTLQLALTVDYGVLTPMILLPPVWPPPISLATTFGISFDFSSSPYLDVSVQAVHLLHLCIQYRIPRHDSRWVAPFGHPRINTHLQLPAAFRSLSRPSSSPGAKAFALRPS